MKDVAKHTGFSISTVSHVINKTRNVETNTRRKILKAMKDLNYVPNTLIRSINKTAVRTIGAIIADIREDFYTEIVTALQARAMEHGYNLLLCDSQESAEKEQFHLNTMTSKGVSAIILAPVDTSATFETLSDSSIPVVMVDRFNEHLPADFVGIDNAQSGAHATRHLLEKGCQNICFLGHHENIYTIAQRQQGYQSALQAASKSGGKTLQIEYFQGAPNKNIGTSELKNFFKKNTDLDGVICGTSSICFEAISVLEALNRKVPKDVRIVTYDDNKWFDYLRTPITSIIQPTSEIASEAVDIAVDRIERPSTIKRKIFLDFSIQER